MCRDLNGQEEFRFLRNQIEIVRNNQSWDFMEESLKEIRFWINTGNLDVFSTEALVILNNLEAPWQRTIDLYRDNSTLVLLTTGFKIFKENSFGELEPYDPRTVEYRIF